MLLEAFDKKGTKYKVGMEVLVLGHINKWYIIDLDIDSTNKLNKISLINQEMNESIDIYNPDNIRLTGIYEPDIFKLKKKLAGKK